MRHMNVDKLFNIRVIISEFEACFDDDDEIEASGITEGQTETEFVEKVAKREDTTVDEGGEEIEAIIVPEKYLNNEVCILKQLMKLLDK